MISTKTGRFKPTKKHVPIATRLPLKMMKMIKNESSNLNGLVLNFYDVFSNFINSITRIYCNFNLINDRHNNLYLLCNNNN